ncbi:hypothetical protein BD408DRAFT_201617 [Parasitella parasitica]|nr:hypothetical protein BD408DRAFT_201617 [Parasitella parasitica]
MNNDYFQRQLNKETTSDYITENVRSLLKIEKEARITLVLVSKSLYTIQRQYGIGIEMRFNLQLMGENRQLPHNIAQADAKNYHPRCTVLQSEWVERSSCCLKHTKHPIFFAFAHSVG